MEGLGMQTCYPHSEVVRRDMIAVLLGLVGLCVAYPGSAATTVKRRSRMVTAQMRLNAVANAERLPWAEKEQGGAIRRAAPYLAMSDRELWMMVTPQSLPRTCHVTLVEGTDLDMNCPNCGKGIIPYGGYAWLTHVMSRARRPEYRRFIYAERWKVLCPNCKEVYPKNDFWAYYLSALDRHGIFQPGKGDPKLLFNTDHPDPDDPLHKFAVDDGYGWHNPKDGRRYDFVAYYNQWGQWRFIRKALTCLSKAYTLTDDPRYAHKAGVLLDRIADVYPEMDMYDYITKMGYTHSEGGRKVGRIEGCIWETNNADVFSTAYDCCFDAICVDEELVRFLRGMARACGLGGKNSFAAIQKNIEDHLLIELAKSVKDGRIRGNEGMHQRAMVHAAIALDRQPLTNQLLDWVFEPMVRTRMDEGRQAISGGNVPYVITQKMDRDGMGNEGSTMYSCWGHGLSRILDRIDAYHDYQSQGPLRDFLRLKLRQASTTEASWRCLGQAVPPIGDSGRCGQWLPGKPRGQEGGHGSIYDKAPAKPEQTEEQIEPAGVNLNGFGLAILQTPKRSSEAAKGRSMWIYYGRNTGHGHRDRLNLGLYAESIDMLPEHGYPEFAAGRPKDRVWPRGSESHNVVTVDDLRQKGSWTGHLLLMEPEGKARVIYVESDGIHKGTTTYRRLSTLVDVTPTSGYVADFFLVRGGKLHRQFRHGPPGPIKKTGLRLKRQTMGTFAGEDVPFGRIPENYRRKWPTGGMFLYDVRRAADPPDTFTVDYDAIDGRGRVKESKDPHLRLTCLTPANEVALAKGDPPRKGANPKCLDYAILTRKGRDLESLFVTLVEPYDAKPVIKSARRLKVKVADDGVMAAAIEMQLANGRADTIIAAEKPVRAETETGVVLEGTFGILARRGERTVFAKLVHGVGLSCEEFSINCPAAEIRGKVLECNTEDPRNNYVIAELDRKPTALLRGRLIIFENDRERDAAFDIVSVERQGKAYKVSLAERTLIRGYKDATDYSVGYVLNVNPGDPLRIPLSAYGEGGQ